MVHGGRCDGALHEIPMMISHARIHVRARGAAPPHAACIDFCQSPPKRRAWERLRVSAVPGACVPASAERLRVVVSGAREVVAAPLSAHPASVPTLPKKLLRIITTLNFVPGEATWAYTGPPSPLSRFIPIARFLAVIPGFITLIVLFCDSSIVISCLLLVHTGTNSICAAVQCSTFISTGHSFEPNASLISCLTLHRRTGRPNQHTALFSSRQQRHSPVCRQSFLHQPEHRSPQHCSPSYHLPT